MKTNCIFTFIVLSFSIMLNAQESRKLTILHTNDFHSHLQGFAPESKYTPGVPDNDPTVGGFSRIAALVSAVKAENPGGTMVLDGGDCLMGTLFHALEPVTGFQLPLMREAGYDVVAVGNHDFDLGPEKYAEIIRTSALRGEIPVLLLGNAVTDNEDPADDKFEAVVRDGLVKQYTIIEKEGVRIGIFSLLGKDADESAPYAPPVTFEKINRSAKRIVKVLNKENCDVIICLSHCGLIKDKKGKWAGEDVQLAKKVRGIDLIVSGHTHTLLSEPLIVKGTPIIQAGSNGMFVGRADLSVTGDVVSLEKYTLIAVDDALAADMNIQSDIEGQKATADSTILKPLGLSYDMQVAESTFEITSDEYGDAAASNLGVLVADAIYYYMNAYGPGADVAMVAAGVLRDPIEPGMQSIADIFRVMSLGSGADNVPGYPLSRMWVTGKELKNITEILLFTSASTPSNFPFYSHLRIEYDPDGRIFNKVRKIELTDNQGNVSEVNMSKDDPKLYSIVANSYMADNLSLVKKKTLGLIKVEPKDADGKLITDLGSAIADFNPDLDGVQEGKEWLALVKYFQQFAPATEGGLPVIPSYYSNPDRSLTAVTGEK